MRRSLSSLLIFLLCLQPVWLHAGGRKLQQVREEVRPEKKTDPKKAKDDDDDDDDDDDWSFDDDDSGDSIVLEGLWGALTTSCWLIGVPLYVLPANAVGDNYHNNFGFQRYPYADDSAGLMWNLDPPAASLGRPEPLDDETAGWRAGVPLETGAVPKHPGRSWSGRVFVEESNDFDGLNRVNAQVLVESFGRLGFQASWSYLRETLDDDSHDELWLGDANLTFLFAQSERVQLRTGWGCRWLADRDDANFGVNFLYGGDFYPAKPWIVSTFLELGNLGSAFVVHGRATAGVILSRFEFFGGYDWLRIGSADLHGPVIGVRLWF